MEVVLDAGQGEVLLLRAVLLGVLHAGHAENSGHHVGADAAFEAGRRVAAGAEEALLAHLLAADGHDDVVGAGGDGKVGLAERCGAGGAGVGHVDDGDAGLPHLLEDALAGAGGLIEVAAVERLDRLHVHAGVLESFVTGLGGEL